jgi:predicted RNA binding protein YcfA (HicA-like mRNA interferase family)
VKVVSGKRMCAILEGRGWNYDHATGSHRVYKNPASEFTIAVPVHGNRDLKRGTQKGIMRQAGLTDTDL